MFLVYTLVGRVFSFHGVVVKVWANDHPPPHVHAIGYGLEARYDLHQRIWITNTGFSGSDLRKIAMQI
ncbi:MAG: DUF4160 domain-containing protein [Proteobacteria bacterium]|nr:MAG: DUF4160 domain-containing protein [Pseudomonadota bacterium]